MSSLSSPSPLWILIIPVKQTTIAKSRLSGFPADVRQRLALAFALDTVTAALACPQVGVVTVVTNDPSAHRFAALGARLIADRPDSGLNPALVDAAQQLRRSDRHASIAALSADLPALRSEELTMTFEAAPAGQWFVADTQGIGSTMLAAASGVPLTPAFGARSRAQHRALGIAEIAADGIATVRRDVDTDVDLWDAERLGVGRHTQAVLDDVRRSD